MVNSSGEWNAPPILTDLQYKQGCVETLTYEKNDSNIDIYKRDGWSIEWNRNI